jgi:hypothetical protein
VSSTNVILLIAFLAMITYIRATVCVGLYKSVWFSLLGI